MTLNQPARKGGNGLPATLKPAALVRQERYVYKCNGKRPILQRRGADKSASAPSPRMDVRKPADARDTSRRGRSQSPPSAA